MASYIAVVGEDVIHLDRLGAYLTPNGIIEETL